MQIWYLASGAQYQESFPRSGMMQLDQAWLNMCGWLNALQVSEGVFEDAAAFTNINSLDELRLANQTD